MASRNSLKQTLRSGRATIGSWITLAHPAIAEIMATAGFEWLAVDLEHSVISLREAEELIRVIELCGVTPLVRLSANDATQIKRVMDAGAHGVIVPMVNSAEDARRAVAAVRYPASGRRGVGLARAQGYGTRFAEYVRWLKRESIVIVQIEHIEAVNNLEQILRTEGVDGFLVGPYDLSGSLGCPGDFQNKKFLAATKKINRTAKKLKMCAGYHVVSSDSKLVAEKIKQGYNFISFGVDFLFLGDHSRNGLKNLRSTREGKKIEIQ